MIKRLSTRVISSVRLLLRRKSTAVALVALSLLLTLAGCTPVQPRPNAVSPTLEPNIAVEPTAAQPGALISMSGSGWRPNETIYLNLETTLDGQEVSTTVAVAKTNRSGKFTISFIYPNDTRWSDTAAVTLTARALTSEREATVSLGESSATVTATVTPTLTSTVTITATRATAVNRGTITGDRVNVRQGPSTDYAVIFVAQLGDGFAVVGQNPAGDWLRVQLDDGRNGWMARAFTDYADTAPIARDIISLPIPPAPSPTANVTAAHWRGEYFANRTLSRSPVLVRNDLSVKFDWGFAAPASIVPADNFSVRWTRRIPFPAGTYRFYVTADDGVRLWIDGEQAIDEWTDFSARTFSVERTFTQTATHFIRIEYYERTERALIDFWWERVAEFPQWRGAYFPNNNLIGPPIVVRNDAAIDFDWGLNSPAPQVPANEFAARWTRSVDFAPGIYRFHAVMDDGLRLFVDGNLILNEWRDGGRREAAVDYTMSGGTHALRVEYYERGGGAVAKVWWERIEPVTVYSDWRGEYWPNTDLSGTPAVVRNDPSINFNWSLEGPPALGVADNFSARWTRTTQFESGLYRFRAEADDGIRLWVDDQLVLDDWRDGGAGEAVADHRLSGGQHTVRVEYYERGGLAAVTVWWERIADTADYPEWRGEYYANRDLVGSPTVVRNDREVNFNWGTNAPVSGIAPDNFSVRWTRNLYFEPGAYRFFVRADDGVRIFIDGGLVINEWRGSDASQVYQVERALGGTHSVAIEYFESLGGARIEFWWQPIVATPTPQPPPTATSLPTSTLEPTATTEPTATATVVPTPTSAVAPAPTIQAAQEPGTAIIAVEGVEFPPGAAVSLYLLDPGGSRTAQTYTTGVTDSVGAVTLSFTMPDTWPDGSPVDPGLITIIVAGDEGIVEARTTVDFED